MMYLVIATTLEGPGSFQYKTAGAAVEKATELIGRGISDVTILAPDGRIYHLSDFPLLLKHESGEYP